MNLIKHKKTRQIDVEWSATSQFPVIISLTINHHQILCVSRLPDQICSVELMVRILNFQRLDVTPIKRKDHVCFSKYI